MYVGVLVYIRSIEDEKLLGAITISNPLVQSFL